MIGGGARGAPLRVAERTVGQIVTQAGLAAISHMPGRITEKVSLAPVSGVLGCRVRAPSKLT